MNSFSRRQIILGSGISLAALIMSLGATQNTSQHQINMDNKVLQQILDRLEIIDTVNRIGLMADLRDWQACQNCFSERVNVDYTSLVGGQPATLAAKDLVESWRKNLSPLKATQHMISNHAVTLNGNTATCISHFQAHHLLPNEHGAPIWTLGGVYHHELERTSDSWKVRKMKMTAKYAEGNQQIMTIAAQQGK